MLFNSYEFILFFFPAVFGVYFWLSGRRLIQAARLFLLAASLFFYSWWDPRHLPVILASIAVNYTFGRALADPAADEKIRRRLLVSGVIFNLVFLGFFKYFDFAIQTVNALTGAHFQPLRLSLPLGISFFTFTQIAFLVDTHRSRVRRLKPVSYGLFVTFFPHLLAGPIVHHQKLMPQFSRLRNHFIRYERVFLGLFYFVAGLSQKVLLADTLAPVARTGFDNTAALTFVEAWTALFAYSLQLYFDFAGYSNMAIGLAHFFNIRFPVNFDSPYQAASIVDFWRRWHVTLSNFLRDYVYIPLGGNQRGEFRRHLNIFATMLLGGLWHGAGWTFVAWGGYHGALICLNHAADRRQWRLPPALARPATFLLVCCGWVLLDRKSVV